MDRVISEHIDVLDTMYREDLGGISFYWGNTGRGRRFKGGEGVAKIIAKHGENVARMMPGVLAKGKAGKPYIGTRGGDPRVNVEYGDHTAVLSLYRFGDRRTWLLTGWENYKASDDAGSIYGPAGTTHTEATPLRRGEGAEAEEKIAPKDVNGKPLFSSDDDTTELLSGFPTEHVLQAVSNLANLAHVEISSHMPESMRRMMTKVFTTPIFDAERNPGMRPMVDTAINRMMDYHETLAGFMEHTFSDGSKLSLRELYKEYKQLPPTGQDMVPG